MSWVRWNTPSLRRFLAAGCSLCRFVSACTRSWLLAPPRARLCIFRRLRRCLPRCGAWCGRGWSQTILSPRYVPCWRVGRAPIRCGPPLPWRARCAGAVPHDCRRRVLLRVLTRAGIAAWAAPVPALLTRRFRPGIPGVSVILAFPRAALILGAPSPRRKRMPPLPPMRARNFS